MDPQRHGAVPGAGAAGTATPTDPPQPAVAELRAATRRRLDVAGVASPEWDTDALLAHVLGVPRAAVRARAHRRLTPAQAAALETLIARRARREPLQLLVGTTGFRHLELEVRPGVFIPRPETEVLAGAAAARVPPGGLVIEPCTGSGAVACALAQETRAGQVIATDTSAAAVALARRNAARTGVAVEVLAGDLLAPVPPALRAQVDVLVANPPYLAAGELVGLQPEVRDWDPPGALVAGPTGHEVADRLVDLAPRWLRPGGWLLLEVDPARASATAARCVHAGLGDVGVLADLTGADRIVIARREALGPGSR